MPNKVGDMEKLCRIPLLISVAYINVVFALFLFRCFHIKYKMCGLTFSTNVVRKTSLCKKNSATDCHKRTNVFM
jgi:hypothetical protein